MTLEKYVEILNWTARQLPRLKLGQKLQAALPCVKDLPVDSTTWCHLVAEFGRMFFHVAGQPRIVDETRSRIGQTRYHIRRPASELFAGNS